MNHLHPNNNALNGDRMGLVQPDPMPVAPPPLPVHPIFQQIQGLQQRVQKLKTTQSMIDQTPIGKMMGYLTPENMSMAGLEVAPVSGELLSGKALWESMNNLPYAGDYINNGMFDQRAYGEAMQSHGGQMVLEGLGAAPLVGAGVRAATHLPDLARVIGNEALRPPMRNQAGMIGGPSAKTADLGALEKAKALKAEGVDADTIYQDTKWWLDHPDGVPRFEIDDSLAAYSPGRGYNIAKESSPSDNANALSDALLLRGDMDNHSMSIGEAKKTFREVTGREPHFHAGQLAKDIPQSELDKMLRAEMPSRDSWQGPLSNVLDHPEFDANYRGNYQFAIQDLGGSQGRYSGGNNIYVSPDTGYGLEKGKSTTLHELQHAIQGRENMARGGSPEMFRSDLTALQELQGMSYNDMDDFQRTMFSELKGKYGNAKSPDELYRRLAGEADARLVQNRMNMGMDERINNPFYKNYDVPLEDQIVRRGDGVQESLGVKPYQVSPTSKEWSEFSIDDINRSAFGFTEGDIKTLNPNELAIKWADDLDNVKHEITKSGKSPKQWADEIDLSEPIDVIFEDGAFKVDDGHHRYMAAKIRGESLPVSLEIKDQPFKMMVEKALSQGEEVHPAMLKAAKERGLKVPDSLPMDEASRIK